MSDERNELADELTGWAVSSGYYGQNIGSEVAQEIAEHLIAAGYSKPRTFETLGELEAHARGFNEGYETAVARWLAPKGEMATEWLEEQRARAGRQALTRLLSMAMAHEDAAVTLDEIRSAISRENQ